MLESLASQANKIFGGGCMTISLLIFFFFWHLSNHYTVVMTGLNTMCIRQDLFSKPASPKFRILSGSKKSWKILKSKQ